MHSNSQSHSQCATAIPLVDFGKLEERYQSLKLTKRAEAVLRDAEPALKKAEEILHALSESRPVKTTFAKMRSNSLIAGKMRPSDARDLMIDANSDFIAGTIHKLAAWRKTMERIQQGEGIVNTGGLESIPANSALGLALCGNACVSNYLSIIQLALSELVKGDKKNASAYRGYVAEIRRCATILSDCENASGIISMIH